MVHERSIFAITHLQDQRTSEMVEAAGVEPASLTNTPAAPTCLAGSEFHPQDNLPAGIPQHRQHVYFSGWRAPSPRPPMPAATFIRRSRRPAVNVTAN